MHNINAEVCGVRTEKDCNFFGFVCLFFGQSGVISHMGWLRYTKNVIFVSGQKRCEKQGEITIFSCFVFACKNIFAYRLQNQRHYFAI